MARLWSIQQFLPQVLSYLDLRWSDPIKDTLEMLVMAQTPSRPAVSPQQQAVQKQCQALFLWFPNYTSNVLWCMYRNLYSWIPISVLLCTDTGREANCPIALLKIEQTEEIILPFNQIVHATQPSASFLCSYQPPNTAEKHIQTKYVFQKRQSSLKTIYK